MIFCYQVEIAEGEASASVQEILEKGLTSLSDTFSKFGCYYNVGYNPELITFGGIN